MLIRLLPASIGGFDCSSCGVATIRTTATPNSFPVRRTIWTVRKKNVCLTNSADGRIGKRYEGMNTTIITVWDTTFQPSNEFHFGRLEACIW